ncbi:hypothetical protein AX17_001840 [Amanita inopinata Kibby_2008]|nr:hypothetical protein AX17_001840 [Amanita inopinata Kibby_2008]
MTQENIQLPTEASNGETIGKHPVFWFSDGSIVLQAQKQLFKVHYTFLSRLSPFFAALRGAPQSPTDVVDLGHQVLAPDLEALLQHLYHDVSLSPDTPIDRIASILRVTDPRLLDFPAVHASAKHMFNGRFPNGPMPNYRPANILEALAVASEYRLTTVRKTLLYSVITNDEFDIHVTEETTDPVKADAELNNSDNPRAPTDGARKRNISRADAKCCSELMNKLIEYFTPVVFTPATTPHMACTDVFADTWMTLVVQPAIDDEGVYKPLETLERLKSIDWAGQGLCAPCVLEKREEWSSEQLAIWDMMDGWLLA